MANSKRTATENLHAAAIVAANVVTTAADAAMKVISEAASEALKTINQRNAEGKNDHDLIIQLDTKLDELKKDIKNLSDGTTKQVDDHEGRIRKTEEKITKIQTWGSAGLVILGVTQFLIGKFVK